MTEKDAQKPREFIPIDKPLEARKVIKEASRNLAPVMIWTKEQKYVINTQISVYHEAEKILYAAVPAETDPKGFEAQLASVGSQDCYFSVSLTRANIFFKAKYIGHDTGGFRFEAPKALFKVQRRKDMRLMIPFGRIIRVELTDPTFPDKKLSKKIFDISAGGLSFIVTDLEALLFHKGARLKDIFFSIGSRKIIVDGEVRHVHPQPADSAHPGHKVGMLFSRIGRGDAQWIAAYVFEESHKIFTHFL